uniref:SFRICE_016909 n=1 Tax=Spodoptera frugiperda TaxID=7108 RepID=A0A2H1VY81_SPOFR
MIVGEAGIVKIGKGSNWLSSNLTHATTHNASIAPCRFSCEAVLSSGSDAHASASLVGVALTARAQSVESFHSTSLDARCEGQGSSLVM